MHALTIALCLVSDVASEKDGNGKEQKIRRWTPIAPRAGRWLSGRFRMSAAAKDPTVLIPCLELSAQGPSGGPAADRARLNTVEHAAVPQVHTPDDRLQGSQQGGELSR